jgi:hypothetical protein
MKEIQTFSTNIASNFHFPYSSTLSSVVDPDIHLN